jgi:hypothetical protein
VAYATAPGTLVAKHSNFISYQDTLELKGVSWFYDCFVTGDGCQLGLAGRLAAAVGSQHRRLFPGSGDDPARRDQRRPGHDRPARVQPCAVTRERLRASLRGKWK